MPNIKDATYLLEVLKDDIEGGQYGDWDFYDEHKWECMAKLVDEIKELIHAD